MNKETFDAIQAHCRDLAVTMRAKDTPPEVKFFWIGVFLTQLEWMCEKSLTPAER